jgi:hypothetical protein
VILRGLVNVWVYCWILSSLNVYLRYFRIIAVCVCVCVWKELYFLASQYLRAAATVDGLWSQRNEGGTDPPRLQCCARRR